MTDEVMEAEIVSVDDEPPQALTVTPFALALFQGEALADALTAKLAASEQDRTNLTAEAETFKARMDAFVIDSPQAAQRFQKGLSQVSTLRKTIEHRQRSVADPLHKAWQRARQFWSPGVEFCKTLEETGNRKMLAWNLSERERAAEAERQRREAEAAAQRERDEALAKAKRARKDDTKAAALALAETAQAAVELVQASVVPEVGTAVRTDHGTGYARGKWTFKVTDPLKVPREFMVVHEPLIRQKLNDAIRVARTLGKDAAPQIDIPGVSFYSDEKWQNR